MAAMTFINPLGPASYRMSSPFGPRINPVTHQAQIHNGQDLAVPSGTPVFAAASGVVTTSQLDPRNINGEWIKLDHGDGWGTAYLHLSQRMVQVGQQVQAGQQIGLSGSTGRSTGPHLHFIVYQNGKETDPAKLVSWEIKQAAQATAGRLARSPWTWAAIAATGVTLALVLKWRSTHNRSSDGTT